MFSSLIFHKCFYDPNFKAQAFEFYEKFDSHGIKSRFHKKRLLLSLVL